MTSIYFKYDLKIFLFFQSLCAIQIYYLIEQFLKTENMD